MSPSKTFSTPEFFTSSLPRIVQTGSGHYSYPNKISTMHLTSTKVDSISVAKKYPYSYSLLAVDEKDEYGVNTGRLLYVTESLEDIDWFVNLHGGFHDEVLHYITGAEVP